VLQKAQDVQKVKIDIYYESLCPDSRNFISYTFWPAFQKFERYLDVKLIPFGKAEINNDGTEYRCQHGPDECFKNIIHICALEQLKKGRAQVEFAVCGMVDKSLSGLKNCAAKSGLTWSTVETCSKGAKGIQLTQTAQQETRTNTPGPLFVPTIVFNNAYSDENQQLAFSNPGPVICKYLNPKPENLCDSA